MVALWHQPVSCPSSEEDEDTVVDLRQASLLPQHRDFSRQGNLSNFKLYYILLVYYLIIEV
jgi:hypothetical protein